MDTSTLKAMKHTDPIWKRLHFERIWALFWLVYVVFYFYIEAGQVWGTRNTNTAFVNFSYTFLFFPLIFIGNAVGHFRREQYWKRIGQRRNEALCDPPSFVATSQPSYGANALTLPFTMHMRWNRMIVLAMSMLIFIPIILLVAIGLPVLFQHNNTTNILIILFATIFMLLLLGLSFYVTMIHYQFSKIEITEEGIKTRYMRQTRFIRWDEARIFASYGAQGLKKSTYAFTYELANEETVVRWSEQMSLNFLLTPESTGEKKDDWNWLVGRVNSLIAMRTGLPLHDLSDNRLQGSLLPIKHNQISSKQPSPTISHAAPPSPIRIAQDDAMIHRLQWNGETKVVMGVVVGLSIVAILIGLFGKIWNNGPYHFAFLSVDMASVLLWSGLLLLGVMVLILSGATFARKYWEIVAKKRQEALRQPERFLVSAQPSPYPQLPSPASVHIRTRKTVFFLMSWVTNFVLWLLFSTVIFQQPHRSFLGVLIGASLWALFMSLFTLPLTGRSLESRIEVRADGISTRFGTIDTHMKWEEARLFARHGRRRRINNSSPRVQNYELAGEHKVVRWQELRSRRWMLSIEPQMSQEEFDRWLEQLHGHIVAHTGLPLLDLDANSGGETHT